MERSEVLKSGYEFDALVIDMDEMGDLFVRTVTEKLEQFFYDGDDRNIIDRYCQGKQLPENLFRKLRE